MSLTLFNEFYEDIGQKIHNFSSDTFKLALIDTVTPTASATDPRWGAGGGTNYSTSEVNGGISAGNYTAGGAPLTSVTFSESAGTATLSAANVAWLQNGSNPTTPTYGILYNSTSAGKECIGFVNLGGTIDMTAGDLTIEWGSGNILTIS